MTRPDGSSRHEHEIEETQAMDEEVAINATVALQGPPKVGSARSLAGVMDGRPVAGKTGTSESFRSAWFVGFTPQLVTAVGMFQPGEDGSEETLTPFGGAQNMTGGTFPTDIWGDIMAPSLEGQEMLDFPERVRLDNETRERSYVPPPPPPPTTGRLSRRRSPARSPPRRKSRARSPPRRKSRARSHPRRSRARSRLRSRARSLLRSRRRRRRRARTALAPAVTSATTPETGPRRPDPEPTDRPVTSPDRDA
ncbi:penicillin-binding transpeptidase domain-containing protein [Brachybacterium sp. Z12]|uniref:penicillin-binding transpeptidase domain-containing protein n=1 Tax=Brachybacterium sp. Z12 TaxID=2759167 RepID=UPI00223C290F|nr:penicillin-binding transpeptidase domain-containing protein [Brachybacterium sp. Z12]